MKKLERESAHTALENFLKKRKNLSLFFHSPYVINTFLYKPQKSLYLIESEGKEYLFTHREKNNDIRFLFDEPTDKLVDAIKKEFDPNYIAVHELFEEPEHAHESFLEAEINIAEVAHLNDPKIKRKYDLSVKAHPEIYSKEFTKALIDDVVLFLENWTQTRSEKSNQHANIETDLNFLALYANDLRVKGLVFYDKDTVVGITFFVPSMTDGHCIAIINKVLRGYTQLGVRVFVDRAKMMVQEDFSRANIATVNSEFKKSFLLDAKEYKVYYYELFRKESFKTWGKYLESFFS